MSSSVAWVAEAAREIAREAREGDDRMLVVVGPTASGKTALAIDLARQLEGEIVNVDSVQIYRGFDIGSGKPTADERAEIPHHLVDLLDPNDAIEASRFRELADEVLADIRARGKRPILAGGTFLWQRAVLYGLAEGPKADAEARRRHRDLAAREGNEALHRELQAADPESAKRLHPNDLVRVSRALEVFELTGRTMTALHEEHGFREARIPHRLVGVRYPDAVLTKRIDERARYWLENGWIEEVSRLEREGFGKSRAMESVGYREVAAFLRGELSREELLPKVVQSTRIFVRRQRTWLARADVRWIEPPNAG